MPITVSKKIMDRQLLAGVPKVPITQRQLLAPRIGLYLLLCYWHRTTGTRAYPAAALL